jgi:hypothetical protein
MTPNPEFLRTSFEGKYPEVEHDSGAGDGRGLTSRVWRFVPRPTP